MIIRTCRGCGCDDNHACVTELGACCWVLLDVETPTGICSVCAVELGWHSGHMLMVGREEEPELMAAAGGARR